MKKYYLLIIGALFLNGCNKNDITSITCNNENVTELLTQLQEESVNEPFSRLTKEAAKALLALDYKEISLQELEAAIDKKQSKFSNLFMPTISILDIAAYLIASGLTIAHVIKIQFGILA